jgi:hypothetical protein
LSFLDTFSKEAEISNFFKIRPVGAELFHADTQMTKLIVAFRNFANAPMNKLTQSSMIKNLNCSAVAGVCGRGKAPQSYGVHICSELDLKIFKV